MTGNNPGTIPDTSLSALGATTLARKWKVDVDTSALQDGSGYLRLMGQTDCTVNPGTAGLQADSDYDGGGYQSQTATTQEWGFTATIRRAARRLNLATYDPAQEYLRGRGLGTGQDNTARVKLYEFSGVNGPLVEAYEGYAAITYANTGGAQDALSMATITGAGQGALLPIPHPAGAAVVAPTVTSVAYGGIGGSSTSTPIAGGGQVVLRGSGFATATNLVVFGNAVPAVDWTRVTDSVIVFEAPAHAAGSGDAVVTNPGGTSGTSAGSKVTYA